jgi:hypothetical protein
MAAVLKTARANSPRGFKSLTLRHVDVPAQLLILAYQHQPRFCVFDSKGHQDDKPCLAK